jgi:hypothetical protein
MYNHSVYSYFKNGTKYLDFNPFISYNIGYWYLDEFMNKKIDAGLLEKLPNELKKSTNNKELLIKTVEKHFYFYPKLIQQIDKNIVKNSYVIFNVYDKLVAEGLAETFKPNIEHTNENVLDDNFKLVFRQPIRRL